MGRRHVSATIIILPLTSPPVYASVDHMAQVEREMEARWAARVHRPPRSRPVLVQRERGEGRR